MPLLIPRPQHMFVPSAVSYRREAENSKIPQLAVHDLDNHDEMPPPSIPHISLSYERDNSEASVRNLVYKLRPKWREHPDEIEFTKFTDGITNTLLRVTRRTPGASQDEVDAEAILMRAYGNNTDLIIDRDREAQSHALLAERGMAPPLLARFDNGLLYKFIPGTPCTPEDLTRERVWRGVARKLAEWHARVPISAISSSIEQTNKSVNGTTNGHSNGTNGAHLTNGKGHRAIECRSPQPNLWGVLQKWVDALPCATEKERAKKDLLQHEIERTFEELDTKNGIGEHGFVFGHLDLLSGNVIMLPVKPDATSTETEFRPVTFIDYEYAAPCPAVFDIANHFAEWAGFDLDYQKIPTRSVRREFLQEYVASYNQFATTKVQDAMVATLEQDIDVWRGIPGLYWGIWALIQATISEIDFNYAEYAEQRLDEYWAWRAEISGTRAKDSKEIPLRERRWAQEI